ncbi:MAG TPA: aminotransferase class III-fold pyridoxal phosphate-dependent enzyme [Candidatus Baltobacteraceae bacterium]|jgi:taurine--2-oxoglutarate transaminase|nr:aminotransferase class III-fold pyridoxal phosphate-dependent enzyme [Candidatus Baltobacteraceae bacterium]
MTTTDDLANMHRRYVLTPWVAQGNHAPPVIVRGEGVRLVDAEGKEYFDVSSGLVAVNLGHGHAAVVEAIAEQARKLCFGPPSYFNDTRAELAEKLSRLSPWPQGGRTFFTTGGGEANEDAVKIARTVTGRHKILTAYRSFHGSAPGAGSLSGEDRRWPNEPGLPGIVHFWAPFPYRSPFFTRDPHEETARALQHLADVLTFENPRSIAAILIEPVVGSNGVIIYPPGYLEGVRQLCDAHGILLIFDEVMTGFGRLGAPFAAQRFGIVPDLLVFAKGVTSAYVPLGGVIVREELASHFDTRPLPCGHTYSGHPLAMAAGLAAVRAYQRDNLFTRGKEIEGWLRPRLERLADHHECIGEVRGIGAFFCLELVSDRSSRTPLVPWQGKGDGTMEKFFSALRARGAYAFGRYNLLYIAPPLVITQHEIEEVVAIIDAALGDIGIGKAR